MITKICYKCKKNLPLCEFRQNKRKRDGLDINCKSCESLRLKQYTRSYTQQRNYDLRTIFKIDLRIYNQMFQNQNFTCKICQRTKREDEKAFPVDHDRSCCPGKKSCGGCIRGILCHECNRGLGQFEDNDMSIQKAIMYLLN